MSKHWILLLDPFRNLLNAYHMILEDERYLVETASNLEGAYELFKNREYSIIITEYIPPFEATDEMIQRVKRNVPETYLIMVTNAIVDEKTYEKLFTIGVDDFILKPYSPEKILVHIRKGIKQRDLILKMAALKRLSLLEPIAERIQRVIFNPTFFRSCIRQEVKKAKRHHRSFSLLLMQIPKKEEIGDAFDDFYMELLKMVKKHTREEDMVGKSNGEIGILLPETDQIGSQALIQRLLTLIHIHPEFKSRDALISTLQTLSFQSFTYPHPFAIPDSLKVFLEGLDQESLPH